MVIKSRELIDFSCRMYQWFSVHPSDHSNGHSSYGFNIVFHKGVILLLTLGISVTDIVSSMYERVYDFKNLLCYFIRWIQLRQFHHTKIFHRKTVGNLQNASTCHKLENKSFLVVLSSLHFYLVLELRKNRGVTVFLKLFKVLLKG